MQVRPLPSDSAAWEELVRSNYVIPGAPELRDSHCGLGF